ncbi:helix-turn-helix transcriptional regulator [Streptomyces sp. NPDC049837]|uniref:helix-turn-helix domain-containing protein n=1 Tax=Streptomyces sp. NPDC049837 TaxID=3155277 RepID=UPI0034336A75
MTTHGDSVSTQEHRLAFGSQVRKLREQAGLSQEALANAAGIHRTYVSSLERGQRNVGLDNIVSLASALNVPPATLLQGL